MELEHIIIALETATKAIIQDVTKTRPQEIAIIGLLVIAIGIGAAVLINQRKIKKQLRELLDQKNNEKE